MNNLIVTPLKAEMFLLCKALGKEGFKPEKDRIGKLPVIKFKEQSLVVASGGLGKTQFGIQTQHLIDCGPPWDFIFCMGTAGALIDKIVPGDVVIGTETIEHSIQNKIGNPLLPRFKSSKVILRALEKKISKPIDFSIHYGPIASGDEDIVDVLRKKTINKATGAFAVAWEGAGGARSAQFNSIPFIEIRGITDTADHDSIKDFFLNIGKAMRNLSHILIDWMTKK